MIIRSYLPFKSAREYVDRGMAKWMGFFISEHTTALNSSGDTIDFSNAMEDDEKHLLLNQVWLGSYSILLYTSKQIEPYEGKIKEIINSTIYLETSSAILNFQMDDVIRLSLSEELDE